MSKSEFTEFDSVLWWDAAASCWQQIDWNTFARARKLGKILDLPVGTATLPNIPAGDHFFAICIVHDREIYNLIVHRYIIDNDGNVAGSPTKLTKREQAEWKKLYLLQEMTERQEARLRRLQGKEATLLQLSKGMLDAILRDKGWRLTDDKECGIWRHYERHYGTLPTGGKAN